MVFGRKGLTLIELVIVIVITGILAGLGSIGIRQVIDSWNIVSSRSAAASDMSGALGRMARNIRSVKDQLSVYSASQTVFAFMRNDGVNVTYNVSGNNLLENNIVLSPEVARLDFTYYNATGSSIADPAVYPDATDIARINIELEIKSRVQNKTMGVMVRPRNLGG